MCGISGWVLSKNYSFSEKDVIRMGESLAHRGPDGSGHHIFNTKDDEFSIALQHQRLAIIDLENGAQPMSSEDNKITLIFNGEIYNFKKLRTELEFLNVEFSTDSDTEVVLNGYKKWGIKIVERLRGQFAFSIWDSRTEDLILARDHYGIKPLFYKNMDNGIIFSSEIKAIREVCKINKIDESIINDYLQYRYVPGPKTMHIGINKFPQGCYAKWNIKNGLKISRYFTPFDKFKFSNKINDGSHKEFAVILENAVKDRMVSDAPYGAFLSGGIDSSAIVALMSKNSNSPVNTFSIGFSETKYSETKYSRLIAEKFECNHTELLVDPDELIEYLPKLTRFRDAPVSEPSDIPIYLLSKEASKTVKMVLTGEGADEFLGGYEKHFLESPADLYRRVVPKIIHKGIFTPLVNSLPLKYWRWKLAIKNVGERNERERYINWFGAIDKTSQHQLCINNIKNRSNNDEIFMTEKGNTTLRKILHYDQSSWLPDNLLERGDRMTMAASIEARMPFMDINIAEFLSQIPDNIRSGGIGGKRILRHSMKNILPEEIIKRNKVGFKVPVKEWFRGDLYGWVTDLLTGEDALTSRYYKPHIVKKILSEHKEGKKNHEKTLWTMATLEIFQKNIHLP